jgi:hypothetical protein
MTRRKTRHEWIASRDMDSPHLVLRIDDYSMLSLQRGQFVPNCPRSDDSQKAIWPNAELAHHAAEWAAKKFGHVYGVFQMTAIVEQKEPPLQTTLIGV